MLLTNRNLDKPDRKEAAAGLHFGALHGFRTLTTEILIGAFLMGGAAVSIVVAIVVDLYPTKFRAVALAVSLMVGRMGALIGINVTGQLFYAACGYFFYIFAVVHIGICLVKARLSFYL